MSKVALTGSTGMVGRHIAALLEVKQFNVVKVDRSIWDLSAWKSVKELDDVFSGVEGIFHFGAYTPTTFDVNENSERGYISRIFDINIRSCACLADWALLRDVPIIFLSGATVYRDPHALNILESNEKTTNSFGGFYGFSKYMAEQIFDHYTALGLRSVLLRPSSIYGVGMPIDRLVSRFVNLALKDDVISIDEPVNNRINLIHASDVSYAALQAYEKKAWGTFNIAGSRNIAISELANYCVDLAGKGQVQVIPSDKKIKPFVRFDLNYNSANEVFDYKPKVDIFKGIKCMIDNQIFI